MDFQRAVIAGETLLEDLSLTVFSGPATPRMPDDRAGVIDAWATWESRFQTWEERSCQCWGPVQVSVGQERRAYLREKFVSLGSIFKDPPVYIVPLLKVSFIIRRLTRNPAETVLVLHTDTTVWYEGRDPFRHPLRGPAPFAMRNTELLGMALQLFLADLPRDEWTWFVDCEDFELENVTVVKETLSGYLRGVRPYTNTVITGSSS